MASGAQIQVFMSHTASPLPPGISSQLYFPFLFASFFDVAHASEINWKLNPTIPVLYLQTHLTGLNVDVLDWEVWASNEQILP